DDFTKECLTVTVAFGISGVQVTRILDSIALFRGYPATIRTDQVNRPGFPGECFICELRLPDHCFRWKHNKLFLLLPEEYGPAFPA
ncbi:transposase family protein, partial [Escherichia coli]|nr:transposase family protein [Escherichia coli]